jgi:hypothetical protein
MAGHAGGHLGIVNVGASPPQGGRPHPGLGRRNTSGDRPVDPTALAEFECSKLGNQIFQFPRQGLRQDRQIAIVQLTTNSGQ